MKKKRTPPNEFMVRRLDQAQNKTEIAAVLSEVRFAGDMKQLAERYGLHYLKSKRMRVRELRQWILDNHPAAKAKRRLVGVDWGAEPDKAAVVVCKVNEDGSLELVETREVDGD